MNTEQARFNMVEQQIRPWDVLDQDVLDVLMRVPREEFVPEAYRNLAFTDMEIPLGNGESMLTPKLEARMLQSLALKKSDNVLEIGTGSGYMTALLASMANHVVSVEIDEALSRKAAEKLKSRGIHNVSLEVGDGARGWQHAMPFDAIVLTGSEPVLPAVFQESLAIGGRLLAVVGEGPVMKARLITRFEQNVFQAVDLFETSIPALKNAMTGSRFVF